MKKILVTIIMPFILLSIMALSCKKEDNSPVEPPTHGTIKGSVVEFGSTDPLTMVNVYSTPPTSFVKTDGSGTYVIKTVEPGEYQIIAAKIGYDTISVNVNVTAGATAVADFILVNKNTKGSIKFGQISGNIFDAKTFVLIEKVNLVTTPVTSSITSDGSGHYQFVNVSPGEYLLKAEKVGYDTVSINVNVYAGSVAEADIYLTKTDTTVPPTTGSIIGNVKDAQTLLSIRGALVSTVPSTSAVFSKDDGSYSFVNVIPGDYTVQISKTGYQDAGTQITVVAGNVTQADFTLISSTGSITGIVTDASTHLPIAGVNIQTQPGTVSITTDSSGKYTLEKIPPASYIIKASISGYTDASLGVVVTAGNTTDADIAMSSGN
ncbi:PEGA domain protein [bacterium BMS3Abin04]|nr:PEGA domain protein [bacterium BMS3Abin04]